MKNMKKMKLYAVISPLCILFAQSALTVQAQKIDDSQLRLAGGKILIDSVLTQKKSDSLKVAFRLHLDSLQLKSEQQLVFTPLIAGEDTIALNPIIINGKNQNIRYLRKSSKLKNSQALPLDTLWQGLSNETVEVKDLQITHHTISLIRDTKQLTISLHQLDEPADIHAEDFSYQITDANGYINYDNTLLPDEELTYTPYKTWTTEFTTPEGTVQERTAHAALMFSRLVLHPVTENDKNAILSIWNKKTGEEVVRINLADFLAQGRGAFEAMNYSAQEFLDREYDYKLDFFLKGDKWQYVKLGISILDWSKRIQRADL